MKQKFLIVKIPNEAKVFNSENTKILFMNLIAEFLKNPSPSNYPGFALAWLDLISCKPFISCFLDDIDSPSKENITQKISEIINKTIKNYKDNIINNIKERGILKKIIYMIFIII